MADAPGSRVGHYRLVEPIGTGGFATVYRAVDERLDSDVAVKILAENHALDPDIRERFITEAQLLRKVSSPAVIEVHDVGETDRHQPFIVMSYADRGDVRRRVTQLGDTAPARDDVDHVVDVLAMALGAVHDAGLVHRDVKPDNLLLSATGGTHEGSLVRHGERLRLGDLGYAKDLGASSGLTVGGGTHGFNAPEQRVGLGSIDQRADVYGASAVVFWLLTGTTPPASAEDRRSHLAGVVDTATGDAIVRGLAEDPDDRFDTIGDWHRAVRRDRSAPAPIPAGTPAPPRWAETPDVVGSATAKRSMPPWPLIVAAVVLVLLLIGGALTIFATGGGPSITTVDDGRVRVQDSDGDLQLAVFGSPDAEVGDVVEFEAAAQGATSIGWLLPDGSTADGSSSIEVTMTSPGSSRITLVGRGPDGAELAVDFPIEVTE